MPGLTDANQEISQHLSSVLLKFQEPDNQVIEKATNELRELSKHSSFLSSLFFVIGNDNSSQVRQLGAVLFQSKIGKNWKSLDDPTQLSIRQAVLQQLTVEPDTAVRRSIMQIVGSISKHELAKERSWPDLLTLVGECAKSADAKIKQCGMQLLSVVCETAYDNLAEQYNPILTLISESLDAKDNLEMAYYAVKAFNSLVPYFGDEQARFVRPIVPKTVAVIKLLLQTDESRAAEIIEVFEGLIETEVSFVAPFVKDLVLFSLEITSNTELEDQIRVRVLSLLQWIIKLKKKAILKHNLIEAILEVLCPIIISPVDDLSDEDDDVLGFIGDTVENQTPLASALQVIDDMALHLPPEKLYSKIMPFIQSCASSNEDCHKRGLMFTLACLSEGTAEYIKNNHLRPFLEIVCSGAKDANVRIRNAAMFAIGQFSEHLQPDVSEFASEIMPILFSTLQQIGPTESKTGSGIVKAYYALENFVENLELNILPYLEPLMHHLLTSLRTASDIHTKELTVSGIGAVANAAKENLLPYLPDILTLIQSCLSTIEENNTDKDENELSVLHTQAIDTLGVLVRTLGENNLELAENSMKLAMNLITTKSNDPDIRCSVYGLCAAVASVVGSKMEPFLPAIVSTMLESVQSTEGIVAHFAEDDNLPSCLANFSFFDDSEETENVTDDEDDELLDGFSVENSYMDEKSDACESLGVLAKNSGSVFEPYLLKCFNEVFKQVDYPHSDVRKSALAACGHFVTTSYQLQHETFSSFLSQLFPVICKTITEDDERLVVMTTIITMKEIVEVCGVHSFADQHADLQVLMESLFKILKQKTACQDEDIDDDDAQQAEYDEMLVEYCGEIFPALAEKLKSDFLPYFYPCLPALLSKLKSTSTVAERSFSAGTIAETAEKLGAGGASEFLTPVIPRFIQLTRDEHTEVRNNSIFGLGVLLQNGGPASSQHYPAVLGCLSAAIVKEKSRRVLDNILGAIARMIASNKELMPLDQVLPVFLGHLPVQEDHDEDSAVYGCLATLLRESDVTGDQPTVKGIVEALARAAANDDVAADVRDSIRKSIDELRSRDPALVARICGDLKAEGKHVLEMLLA